MAMLDILDSPHEYQEMHMMPDLVNLKTKRMVGFSPTSKLHVYEVPPQQIAISSWYSPHEEQRFKYEADQEKMMFRRMKEQGCDVDKIQNSSSMCPFGLEQQLISREYTKMRAIKKRLVMLAVLREQALTTLNKGDDKWERIARASRQHSEWSRAQAQTIGSFQAS